MFGKKDNSVKNVDSSAVNTLIGEGCLFEGNLNLSTSTRIDGVIKGNVKSEGMLIVGESGSVEGDIQCSEILIYGRVKGNIVADRIELKKGASLTGDIKTALLIIEEGAYYNGHCSMGDSSEAPSSVE